MMQITLQVEETYRMFSFFALTPLRTLDRNFSHSLQWANHILS